MVSKIDATAPPPSNTVTWHGWVGVGGLCAALFAIRQFQFATEAKLLLILSCTAIPVLLFEARRAFPRRQMRRPYRTDLKRIAFKLAALAQIWIIVMCVYWVIPFYVSGPGAQMLSIIERPMVYVPFCLVALLYICLEDLSAPAPEDELFRFGRWIWGFGPCPQRDELRQLALAWTIKGFFLPIMISGVMENIHWWTSLSLKKMDYFPIYEILFSLMYFIDVVLATVGYLCTLKLFDTQIRSSQPQLVGWVAALICYPPFWNGISDSIFRYNPDGREWGYFFGTVPLLSHIWAAVLLALVFLYVASTIQFGVRFSNLTNRGILTNGPYRWFKHPAYLAKNLSWWMLAVPFISHTSYLDSLRNSLLLLALNGIYFLRAKTEEHHLSEDVVYREYLAFMERRGLGAILRRGASNLFNGAFRQIRNST